MGKVRDALEAAAGLKADSAGVSTDPTKADMDAETAPPKLLRLIDMLETVTMSGKSTITVKISLMRWRRPCNGASR